MFDGSTVNNSQVDNRDQDRVKERDAVLRLTMVPGVGPRTYRHLMQHFGSAQQVLMGEPAELRQVAGVSAKVAAAIALADEIDIEPQIRLCEENQIGIIDPDMDQYPEPLKEIYDPPNVLYVRGELRPEHSIAIAIVGSRHATRYGLKMAESLKLDLTAPSNNGSPSLPKVVPSQ